MAEWGPFIGHNTSSFSCSRTGQATTSTTLNWADMGETEPTSGNIVGSTASDAIGKICLRLIQPQSLSRGSLTLSRTAQNAATLFLTRLQDPARLSSPRKKPRDAPPPSRLIPITSMPLSGVGRLIPVRVQAALALA